MVKRQNVSANGSSTAVRPLARRLTACVAQFGRHGGAGEIGDVEDLVAVLPAARPYVTGERAGSAGDAIADAGRGWCGGGTIGAGLDLGAGRHGSERQGESEASHSG